MSSATTHHQNTPQKKRDRERQASPILMYILLDGYKKTIDISWCTSGLSVDGYHQQATAILYGEICVTYIHARAYIPHR